MNPVPHADVTGMPKGNLAQIMNFCRTIAEDNFIITAYYTDTVKRGRLMGEDISVWYDEEGTI
jgi:hypothetical protein